MRLPRVLSRRRPSLLTTRSHATPRRAYQPRCIFRADDGSILFQLTRRQVEVLAHLANGLTNEQIADRLGYSTKTVKNYNYELFSIMDATSRVDAVVIALRIQAIELPPARATSKYFRVF